MDQPVADYNTEATGLTAADVEGHVTLHMAYVQVHDCFIWVYVYMNLLNCGFLFLFLSLVFTDNIAENNFSTSCFGRSPFEQASTMYFTKKIVQLMIPILFFFS